jgi:hypothetical protein
MKNKAFIFERGRMLFLRPEEGTILSVCSIIPHPCPYQKNVRCAHAIGLDMFVLYLMDNVCFDLKSAKKTAAVLDSIG